MLTAEEKTVNPVDALFEAMELDDVAQVRSILGKNPTIVNEPETKKGGWVALGWAAAYGKLEIVNLLLDCGANVNHSHGDGSTALSRAINMNNLQVAEVLVARGAAVAEVKVDYSGCKLTLLAVAFKFFNWFAPANRMEILNFLIKNGASFDLDASVFAIRLGLYKDFREQINHVVRSGLTGSYGDTVLHFAVKSQLSQKDLIDLISVNRRALQIKNHFGHTILHLCSSACLVAPLVKEGAKVNAQDSNGNTPLHMAVIDHNIHRIEALLKAGAQANIPNNAGHTPLVLARRCSRIDPGLRERVINLLEPPLMAAPAVAATFAVGSGAVGQQAAEVASKTAEAAAGLAPGVSE